MKLVVHLVKVGITGLLTLATAEAAVVVIPNSAATTEQADELNSVFNANGRTYQVQINQNQLPMPTGSLIEGISFRLDSLLGVPPETSFTYDDFEITLGQALNTFQGMTTTFANNMVSPVKVVDGPLTVTPGTYPSGAPGGAPNAFGAMITFDQPYTYLGGHLVVLITHTAAQGGGGLLLDAAPADPDYAVAMRSFSYQAERADVKPDVVTVMQFQFTAVPEPAEYAALGAAGLIAFAGWRRFRRR